VVFVAKAVYTHCRFSIYINRQKQSMKKNLAFFLFLLCVTGTGFFIWNSHQETFRPPESSPSDAVESNIPEPDGFDEPTVLYPVTKILTPEAVIPQAPLPLLDESDNAVESTLAGLFPRQQLGELFRFKNAIRHFVVTVDNATGARLPRRYSFTHRPQTRFIATETEEGKRFILDAANSDRYTGFVHFVENLEINNVVFAYVKFYPLFQQAYEELGYTGYFNDRLIAVIDHLLDTPEVPGEIKLVKPKYFYKFADPELESLSSAQKILLRIGHTNATKIKEKLKALRAMLLRPKLKDE